MKETKPDTITVREIVDHLDDESLTGREFTVPVERLRAIDRYVAMHAQAQGEIRLTADAIERYGLEA